MPVSERLLQPDDLLSLPGNETASQLQACLLSMPVMGHVCSTSWSLLTLMQAPFYTSFCTPGYMPSTGMTTSGASPIPLCAAAWICLSPTGPSLLVGQLPMQKVLSHADLHARSTGSQCCCRLWQHLHHPSMLFYISAQRGHHGHAVSFICSGRL